jgi:hypothetical protein
VGLDAQVMLLRRSSLLCVPNPPSAQAPRSRNPLMSHAEDLSMKSKSPAPLRQSRLLKLMARAVAERLLVQRSFRPFERA